MTTTVPNTNIFDAENKKPDTSGLVIISILYTRIGEVENKTPDVSGLVKNTDYDAKTSNIEEKNLLPLIIIKLQKKYLMQG